MIESSSRNPLIDILKKPRIVRELRSFISSSLRDSNETDVLEAFRTAPCSLSPQQVSKLNDAIFELFTGCRPQAFPIRTCGAHSSANAASNTSAFITVTPNPALDICGDLATLLQPKASYVLDPAGKGLNMSVALTSWGVTPISLGFIGGPYGSIIASLLQQISVSTESLTPVTGHTRCNISVHIRGHDLVHVTSAGPVISEEEQTIFQTTFSSVIKQGDIILLGGSLPPGVPTSLYRNMIGIARAAGATTYLDTSGQALVEAVQARPSYLGINLDEFAYLTGQPADVLASDIPLLTSLMRRYVDLGIETVVVSRGSQGMILVTSEEQWLARPPVVEELSATGSGDMINVAFAYGKHLHMQAKDILRLATAASAATVTKPGTGMASLRESKALLDSVCISEAIQTGP